MTAPKKKVTETPHQMNLTKSVNMVPADILPDDPMFIPMYHTAGAACCDLVANIPEGEVRLLPGRGIALDVGFRMALRPGWEVQIRAKSGLARSGIQVTNGIGTIDSDFRGRLEVLLNNSGKEIVVIKHGQRVAQMAIKPAFRVQWNIVKELDVTERNEKGFGSTGV